MHLSLELKISFCRASRFHDRHGPCFTAVQVNPNDLEKKLCVALYSLVAISGMTFCVVFCLFIEVRENFIVHFSLNGVDAVYSTDRFGLICSFSFCLSFFFFFKCAY